jgi:hypothetical protein
MSKQPNPDELKAALREHLAGERMPSQRGHVCDLLCRIGKVSPEMPSATARQWREALAGLIEEGIVVVVGEHVQFNRNLKELETIQLQGELF